MKTRAAVILAAMLVPAEGSLSAQPNIEAQPTNQTVMAGGTATFSVVISGNGPSTSD